MKKIINAFQNDALGFGDATDVAERIRSGEISAQEATDAAIKRSQQCAELQAIRTDQFEQAHARAAQNDFTGPFAGVPFYVKDNLDVEGLPTQHGSQAFVSKPRRGHDPVVKQILAQGFNVLGKTDMPELGLSGTSEHADRHVRNPWNIDHTAGGSSGGSAALVAAGAVPIAHGNDGAGSIRIPASMNGLFGLKCSRNRLITSNLSKPLPLNIITDGVLSRSVRDAATFFAATEQYKLAKKLPPIGEVNAPVKQRLTIGVLRHDVMGNKPDANTARVLAETEALLSSLGHNIVDAKHPVDETFENTFKDYFCGLAFGAQKLGKKIYGSSFNPDNLNTQTKALANHYKRHFYRQIMSPLKFVQARKRFEKEMSRYDLVLSPTLNYLTPELGYLNPQVEFNELMDRLTRLAIFNPIYNALGTPAMSVPLGVSVSGLPIGMHFGAQLGQERLLLELAFELEAAKSFTTLANHEG